MDGLLTSTKYTTHYFEQYYEAVDGFLRFNCAAVSRDIAKYGRKVDYGLRGRWRTS